MKKFMTIALLLLAGLTASAQGGWHFGKTKGDELLGTESKDFYNYSVKDVGTFTLYDWDGWTFTITTDKGFFDAMMITYNDGRNPVYYVDGAVGLYNMEGKLVEKMDIRLQTTHQDFRLAWVNENWNFTKKEKKMLQRMINAIRTGEGYVRVLMPRRRMKNLDLKVMPLTYNPYFNK